VGFFEGDILLIQLGTGEKRSLLIIVGSSLSSLTYQPLQACSVGVIVDLLRYDNFVVAYT